jgi:hypothetical protein
MDLTGFPGREQSIAWLKAIAESLEAGDAASNFPLSFQQTDIYAALRKQGGGCKPADPSAYHNYFAIHVVRKEGELMAIKPIW